MEEDRSMARIDTRPAPKAALGAFALLLAIAVGLAGCGSSATTKSSAPTSTAPATSAVAPTLPPSGQYVAPLTTDALDAAGVDTLHVGAGGLWHLSISPSTMKLTAPAPGPETTYSVVAITKNRLTLAGNPECSVPSAKTQKSVYTISTSPKGLRFAAVKVACKEDGGILTTGYWTKP